MHPERNGPPLPLTPRDELALEKAERAIEANRRGDVIVRVADENGQPLRDVPVRYQQRRLAFGLGVHYPYQAQTYDLLQEAGINAATLWLGWEYVQPEPGVFNWDYLERVWSPAALSRRGLRLTAHALSWFKPGWRVLPPYLLETPPSDLPHLVYDHVSSLARRWGDLIEVYELVNEPFWADASAIPLELEDMVRICHATALAVRDVVPQARLELNFAEVSRLGSYGVRPFDLLDSLEEAEVPYDRIGLQALENGYTVTAPPTFYRTKTFTGILQVLRQYAKYAREGKTLNISALAVPTVPPSGKPPSRFKLPYGEWSEPTQAAYLDAAYTLFYAQPEVEGITWWCPVDGRLALIPGGGLLREDLSPKPSYRALKGWVTRHTSSGQAHTDEQGRAVIRGYAGEYEFTVGTGSLGRRFTYQITAGRVEDRMVVLAYNP